MRIPKKKLKYNRGILLSLILALCLACYAVADELNFKQQTSLIEKTIRNYTEESIQMSILPPPYNSYDHPAPEDITEKKMVENELFLKRYWSFEPDEYNYNQGAELLDQVNAAVVYNSQGMGSVDSGKCILQYLHSIRKISSNRAEVSFTYTGSAKITGKAQWVLFSVGEEEKKIASYYKHNANLPKELPVYQVNTTGDVTAIMIKVNGVWKFDSVEYANILYH